MYKPTRMASRLLFLVSIIFLVSGYEAFCSCAWYNKDIQTADHTCTCIDDQQINFYALSCSWQRKKNLEADATQSLEAPFLRLLIENQLIIHHSCTAAIQQSYLAPDLKMDMCHIHFVSLGLLQPTSVPVMLHEWDISKKEKVLLIFKTCLIQPNNNNNLIHLFFSYPSETQKIWKSLAISGY